MSYKSRLLSYSTSVTALGTFDGTVNFDTPLRVNSSRPHTFKVVRASITSNLPNVYNYGSVNNGLIRVSNDGGSTWTTIQLTDGVYSVNSLNNAINDVISVWMTSSSDSAFILRANTVINKCYIIIDSTKLSVGIQFAIDFGDTISLAYDLLGFVATQNFNTDGTHTGDAFPKLDYQGNNVKIFVNGFGPLAIEEGESTKLACTIPLSTSSVLNEYVYGQNGEVPFEVPCKVSDPLTTYSIEVRGDNSNTIVGYDGKLNLQFLLTEY